MAAIVSWIVVYASAKLIRDAIMHSAIRKDANSHWSHIKALKSGQQWLHVSYFVSMLHALTLLVLQAIGTFSCKPPAAFSNPNAGFLSNTVYTNEFCIDNGNWWECVTILTFTGYLVVDFLVCLFLMDDNSTGMLQNYLHHGLGVVGTATALIVGRMILTLSNATCITELSTPFVSARALLSMHKKSSSTVYMVNGLLMTFSFFLFRVCFQAWLIIFKLAPAVFGRGETMLAETSELTKACCWFSLGLYMTLVVLNCFWFNMML